MGKHVARRSVKLPIQISLPNHKRKHVAESVSHNGERPERRGVDFSRLGKVLSKLFKGRDASGAAGGRSAKAHEYDFSLKNVATIGVGALLFLIVWLIPSSGWLRVLTFVIPYLLLGYETLRDAVEDLLALQFLSRSFLILLATIGAFLIGEYPTAVFVMLLFRVVLMAEAFARERRDDLTAELSERRVQAARLAVGGGSGEISSEAVESGSILLVQNGETIAADGMVIDGISTLDLFPLTGRMENRDVGPGSSVYSGMINRGADIRVQVTAPAASSTAETVIDDALKAGSGVPQSEQLLRYLFRLLPALFAVVAVLIGLIVPIFAANWREWISRALLLLAISGTLPLLQSLAFNISGSISRAALNGIYFKQPDTLDKLSRTASLVLSKTGTVTEGRYKVENVFSELYAEKDLLMIAALAECQSRHPIAQALREACGIAIPNRGDIHIVEEIPCRGVTSLFSGRTVTVGSAAMLMDHGIAFSIPPRNGTVIHVAVDGEYAGHIVMSDRIRDGAFDALEELHLRGVGETVMLTGDVRATARQIASSLNFDLVKSDLTPEGKISAVDYLKSSKGDRDMLTYVSSSEEDLSILQHADVAFGFDALGKNALIDQADVYTLDGNLHRLPAAYALARRCKEKARFNMTVYAAVKALLFILAVTGVFSIWLSVFLDALAGIAVLLNATRK